MKPRISDVQLTHHVVIIGGGFGGLYAAKALKRAPAKVTLIDRRNFHLFQPLLYQVATGGLSPGDIASPLRAVLKRNKNVRVIMAEVTDINVNERSVTLRHGERISYDSLIVAAGSGHHYFGNDHWRQAAPGLKTIEDALEMRRRILYAFEVAELEKDAARRHAWLTFVVVGAGPTGVELAGTLGEMANYTLRKDFTNIDPTEAKVLLVESADRVLLTYPPSLSRRAEESLGGLGVEVRLNSMVSDIKPDQIVVKEGNTEQTIPTRTVLWAAGVQASALGKTLVQGQKEILDRSGRVMVKSDLTIPGHPDVFVIGDLANYPHQTGQPLPGLAPVAMQQGRYAARLICNRLKGKESRPFHYTDKGNLATIGRAAAVGSFGRLKFSGYFAWLTWLFVHLMYLVEFDNRLLVLIQWAWNYFTWNRSARLITGQTLPPSDDDSRADQVTSKLR